MSFYKNFSLKEYNSYGLDVKSKMFFSFEKEEELIFFIKNNEITNYPFLILGGGSNILFRKNFEGIIFHSKIESIDKLFEDKNSVLLRVGSGLEWDRFVVYCVEKFYYGIENLSLIPGNVGASPVQNIGAYGTEVKEIIEGVTAYHLKTGEGKYFTNKECDFSYRSSIFKKKEYADFIITSVDFRLSKISSYSRKINNHKSGVLIGILSHYKNFLLDIIKAVKTVKFNVKRRAVSIDYRYLRKILEDSGLISLKKARETIVHKRNSKIPHPSEVGNVGSFFKNPIVAISIAKKIESKYQNPVIYPFDDTHVKISAGWLIKQIDWVFTEQEENVGLYKDQTLIIINKGNAKGNEIYDYSQRIVDSVKSQFQIDLEREVVVV